MSFRPSDQQKYQVFKFQFLTEFIDLLSADRKRMQCMVFKQIGLKPVKYLNIFFYQLEKLSGSGKTLTGLPSNANMYTSNFEEKL